MNDNKTILNIDYFKNNPQPNLKLNKLKTEYKGKKMIITKPREFV